ncbi:hemolysin family protein [Filimonas effusa]|uniref:HlyC/CorC family transporter n=1 Tax=Filimonas effusa TaxID=2508721 RepID=A0A4Q1DAK3_9BACT|nr:hemolysin family protein [Filimonas effusa]RXK86442.1 HlyC/CorC family transporter [Filimonas effusa]
MIEIFIILGLILLNGLFSMAEIALVSSRRARLESQANKGDLKAKEALKLATHPETFLSTVQIGITLIGILTGIFSGENLKDDIVRQLVKLPVLVPYSGPIATAILLIVVTYLSLVIGELVPKRLGLSMPETIAKNVAAPMRLLSRLTYPFIVLLTKSSNLLVKLFHIKGSDASVTEEEIKAIINEGTEQGTIEEAEQEIIERVFHLGDRNITSLMTHRTDIVWLNTEGTVADLKAVTSETAHSVYPVCDGSIDALQGVVYLKDLFLSDPATPLTSFLRPAMFVPENNTAYQVLERFKETNNHYAFIVDEYGTMQGMITLNDILQAIVGDMAPANEDDYEIIQREDGSYLIDAQIPFYDFLARFDQTEWMHEGEHEFDTLAGFILHQLERIPQTGEKLSWRGFTFEIIDMDALRIDKILVTVEEGTDGK